MSYIVLIKKLVPWKKNNLRAAVADWRRSQWGLGISCSIHACMQSTGRRGRPPAPWLAQGSPAPGWHRGALWWGRSHGVAVSCAGHRGGLFREQNQHTLPDPAPTDGSLGRARPRSPAKRGEFGDLPLFPPSPWGRTKQFPWQPAAAPSPTEAAVRSHAISLIISLGVDLEPRPS